MSHHLVGVTEIARMFGVSRQRAHQIAQADDFPRPVVELASGRVWETAAVEAWGHTRGTGARETAATDEKR